MIQQLYHVGQHGDSDNSFAPNWSPSGLPSYPRRRGSHADVGRRDRRGHRRVRRAATPCSGAPASTASRSSPPTTPSSTSSGRRGRTGGPTAGVARSRIGCASRRRSSSASARAVGDDFIIGLAVSDGSDGPACPADRHELAEIVAWHDERGLMDYVTCGTGCYFDFYPIIPTSPVRAAARRRPFAAALKEVVATPWSRPRATSARRPRPRLCWRRTADLVSIVRGQIADPHLVAKAQAGRPQDVRPCISCNQMCWGRRSRDYWISCLVNPSAGREFEWGGDRFDRRPPCQPRAGRRWRPGGPRGGPGRRRARPSRHARRGDGRARRRSSGSPAGSRRASQILDLLAWYGRQLEQLGVDVQLGRRASR